MIRLSLLDRETGIEYTLISIVILNKELSRCKLIPGRNPVRRSVTLSK